MSKSISETIGKTTLHGKRRYRFVSCRHIGLFSEINAVECYRLNRQNIHSQYPANQKKALIDLIAILHFSFKTHRTSFRLVHCFRTFPAA